MSTRRVAASSLPKSRRPAFARSSLGRVYVAVVAAPPSLRAEYISDVALCLVTDAGVWVYNRVRLRPLVMEKLSGSLVLAICPAGVGAVFRVGGVVPLVTQLVPTLVGVLVDLAHFANV